jgi:hypothetical protein
MAEGVEKVGPIKFSATIVPVRRAFRNIDSMGCQILNHCFKNCCRRDFFNTLGYKQKSEPTLRQVRFAPHSRHSSADVGFGPYFVCLTPESGRFGQGRGTSARDPNPKLIMRGRLS